MNYENVNIFLIGDKFPKSGKDFSLIILPILDFSLVYSDLGDSEAILEYRHDIFLSCSDSS